MSNISSEKKKNKPVITDFQMDEYNNALKNRYMDVDGIAKSRELHKKYYYNDKRAFEENLFDNLGIKENTSSDGFLLKVDEKSLEMDNAAFIKRAKTLIANRNSYAYSDQVDNAIDKYLDDVDFFDNELSEEFFIDKNLDEKQKKNRQKEIVKHVTSKGIDSLTNIRDIISWMEAHIAIKGDDRKEFKPILGALIIVQESILNNKNQQDLVERINKLSDAINKYMASHSKIPFTAKGKERIAICQVLSGLTGKMVLEGEKNQYENALAMKRDQVIRDANKLGIEKYKNQDIQAFNDKTHMKDWVIANTDEDDLDFMDLRDAFVDIYYLINNEQGELSSPELIIRATTIFEKKASDYIKNEGTNSDKIKLILDETKRISDCMKWTNKHQKYGYKDSLRDSSYTPKYLDYRYKSQYASNVYYKYNQDLKNNAETEVTKLADTQEKKELLNRAYISTDYIIDVDEVIANPGIVIKKDGNYSINTNGNEINKAAKFINTKIRTSYLKLYISKNDAEEYEKNVKSFQNIILDTITEAMSSLVFNAEMEDVNWYIDNCDTIGILCKYADYIERLKSSADFNGVYNSYDESKRSSLDIYSKFWKSYNERMMVRVYKETHMSHYSLSNKQIGNEEKIENEYEKQKESIYEHEKNDTKKVLVRSRSEIKNLIKKYSKDTQKLKAQVSEDEDKMSDFYDYEGAMRLLSEENLTSATIAEALGLLEKISQKLGFESIDEIIKSCRKYGESLSGESKEQFDREYNSIVAPTKFFNLSKDAINRHTRRINDISELTIKDKINYMIPLYGIESQSKEYKEKIINLVNDINDCNRIIMELMTDIEVKKYFSENTQEIVSYHQQSDINYATVLVKATPDVKMLEKWQNNPEQYGFKENGALKKSMIPEIIEAYNNYLFHNYICWLYENLLVYFLHAVENNKYKLDPQKTEKYKNMALKLEKNSRKLEQLYSKSSFITMEGLDLIKRQEDYIPEEGEKKHSPKTDLKGKVLKYTGFEDWYKFIQSENYNVKSFDAKNYKL